MPRAGRVTNKSQSFSTVAWAMSLGRTSGHPNGSPGFESPFGFCQPASRVYRGAKANTKFGRSFWKTSPSPPPSLPSPLPLVLLVAVCAISALYRTRSSSFNSYKAVGNTLVSPSGVRDPIPASIQCTTSCHCSWRSPLTSYQTTQSLEKSTATTFAEGKLNMDKSRM
ncbi:hypothetical protein CBL_00293 [Carabus blaptoides fortunei]